MPELRSKTSTHGRTMAGARALWRATGMTDDDFGKPIVAIANSFTQFVPGHVHLKDLGQLVAGSIAAAGGVGREFNTIAVDDGIAMGHGGMLYSLPSRELIADAQLGEIERSACPTCGSCSGMFTANSMNCLTEAIGLALPGNGSTLATHAFRKALFERAGRVVVDLARRYYDGDDSSVLPRSVASRHAFENAMALDVAMGGSTNTVLHLLAAAREAGLDFGVADIDEISRRVPCVSKVAPSSSYHMEDVHRAGGIPAILGELDRAGLLHRDVVTVHSSTVDEWLGSWDIRAGSPSAEAVELFHAAPGGVRTNGPFSHCSRRDRLDTDAA